MSKPSGTVNQGNKVSISAKATGGAGEYKYRFVVKANSSTIVKNYSSANKATWTIAKAGKYSIIVYAKDKNGKIATKTIKGYKVNRALKVSSFKTSKASGKVSANTKITLKAKATGGAGSYYYRFGYKLKGTNKITYIGYYSDKNSATWKPKKKGTYTLYAYVLDEKTDNVVKKTVSKYKVN